MRANDLSGLAKAFGLLDGFLAIAVEKQARLLGPQSLLDPWRGMHIGQADVQRALQSDPDAQSFSADVCLPDLLAGAMQDFPRAAVLAKELNLSNTDLAILLIALAPDIDRRYERIYAYLQDDIACRRPTLDLFANLLARDAHERLALYGYFDSSAPLLRMALLVKDGAADTPPLACPWRIEDLWRNWLLGNEDIHTYRGSAKLLMPAPISVDEMALDQVAHALTRNAIDARRRRSVPVRILIQGPHGSGKYLVAQAVAHEMGQKILVLDVREYVHPADLSDAIRGAQRAVVLFNAVLYLHGVGRLEQRDPQLLRALVETLATSSCNFIVALQSPLAVQAAPIPVLRIELRYPTAEARHRLWRNALAAYGLSADEDNVKRIADGFSLSRAQISQAAAEAHALALNTGEQYIGYDRLTAAARAQCGAELTRIAQRIQPEARFDDLIVPQEVAAQLKEICARVATRDTVARKWAQSSVHARATGVTALFVGPSGTGKTLSAEALASELGLDLYRIDLAGIVSKYIGETEKNLDRVFTAAENANAVLFFDEADALFGKRSEVKDAHDRYANIEIAYLLQKMEQFDGLAILATNLKQNLDEAFARRLTFTITFPFPEEPERQKLWIQLWPPSAPRHDDVDLSWFAKEFRLSGGNIRNTVLAAAHFAAADGKVITRNHLLHAARREYQKLGKNLATPRTGSQSR